MRQAGLAGERMQLQGTQQAAMIAAQEQQAARQAMAQLGMGARGQALTQASEQERWMLEQQRQKDAMRQYFMGMESGLYGQQTGLNVGQQQHLAQLYGIESGVGVQQQALQNQASAQRSQAAGQAAGTAAATLGTIASAIPASDRRAKKNVRRADKDLEAFLKALKPSSYDYKEPDKPGRKPGRQYGFMAQDALKSDLGKTLVMQDEEGTLRVDTQKVAFAALAAAAHLAKKMERRNGRSK
jgi:hypothetical protein